MTRGVSGTLVWDMVQENGGSAGVWMTPATMRQSEERPECQKVLFCIVEWRCLSRRDERIVVDVSELSDSSGGLVVTMEGASGVDVSSQGEICDSCLNRLSSRLWPVSWL